jgi:predicted RNase H-like nuclease (RuvC/YqgF family)
VSAEWLLRGEGEKYKTDVPHEGDSEEIEDLRIELTKVHAERDELRQVVEDLKRQARDWRESDEYKQTFAELRAEAAELRARLDEQRTNFRILAESIGRQPQQPVITGTIPRIKLPHAVAATAAANMAAGVPVALAIGDAENLPGAFAAKATKSKKNIG